MATPTTRQGPVRSSSDERREQVIEAAVKEFAAHGFHAASTSAIAKRAGISQPYIYALFPNKRELFLAVDRHVVDRIRRAFLEAVRGRTTPEDRLEAMAFAYIDLLEDRDEIRFQMEDVRRMSGASDEAVTEFMAKGMLLNVAASLELPDEFLPPLAKDRVQAKG
jgi:AcrR family transcriptional regulator